MMKKNCSAVLLTVLFFALSVRAAEIGMGLEAGVGVRALGFANNHVAAANDLSAVYWNPAALALLPVREFQVSFEGLRIRGKTDIGGGGTSLPGAKSEDYMDRLRGMFSGAGWMTAIPTTQGGLTIAFSFDRPFMFNDISVYTFTSDDGIYTLDTKRHGDLNRWSGAFGVQVTDKISAGLTLSIVTGTEESPNLQVGTRKNDVTIDTTYYHDLECQNNYLGYTLTGGFLYYPIDILKIGLRINAAMNIGYEEKTKGRWTRTLSSAGYECDDNPCRDQNGDLWMPYGTDGPYAGRAYTAPTATLGTAVTLPWLIAALDLRATMPYTFILPSEKIPDDVQAKYYKLGAGVGVEAPLPMAPVVFRAGYSIDEYDLYPIVYKPDDDFGIPWRLGEESGNPFVSWPDGYKHTLTFGAGVFTSGLGLEMSYAYQTWGLKSNGWYTMTQKYSNHRVAAALIYRY